MLSFSDEVVARFWNHGSTHASCTVRSVEGGRVYQAHISWFPYDMFVDDANLRKRASPYRTARAVLSYGDDKDAETGTSTQERFVSQEGYDLSLIDAEQLWQEAILRPDRESRKDFVQGRLSLFEDELETDASITKVRRAQLEYIKVHVGAILAALEDASLAARPTFAPIEADRAYDRVRGERGGQKRAGETVVTKAASKICVPGLGAITHYQHVQGDRVLAKNVAPAVLQRENQRFPEGQAALFGLNLHALLEHWTAFVSNERHAYRYISTTSNCAGVVIGALKAGGAGAYVSTETGWLGESVLYVKPSEVEAVIQSLVRALVGVNRDARWFMNDVDSTSDLFRRIELDNGDLWSARTFASKSKSPNKMSMRREQVGHIDKALAAYHRAGAGFTRANFETKLAHLVTMMYWICDHRRKKPNSDRRVGVDSLGVQIIQLMSMNPISAMYGTRLSSVIESANRAARTRMENTAAAILARRPPAEPTA